MEKLYILILSVLFSAILAMIGYWVKAVHKEFKQLLKELTDYTTGLKQLIVGIQTQINKGIETDIQELKHDIKTLYTKSNKNESKISKKKKKVNND